MITGTCTRLVCFSYTQRLHTHTQTHPQTAYSKSHYKMNFMITKFQKTVLEQMAAVCGLSPGMIREGDRASASPPAEVDLPEGLRILGTTKHPSAKEPTPGGESSKHAWVCHSPEEKALLD